MPTLAGIDTTIVYHEFDFHCDQVNGLKLQQYFIIYDMMEWLEEILANKFREYNFIKIIYEELYHFDIEHVKCVEIYYGEDDLEDFQSFKSYMNWLIAKVQYTMPWISDTIYYVRNELPTTKLFIYDDDGSNKKFYRMQAISIECQLLSGNLMNNLLKSNIMQVKWSKQHGITAYEFEPNLNEDQLKRLEEIFKPLQHTESIIMNEEFTFLKITEPPIDMNYFILTIFRHQLLSCLTIQDLLSLELANKDHRFEFYNSILDRDIQLHLQKRLTLLWNQEKLVPYMANGFTDARVFKYFLYKYRDSYGMVEFPNKTLNNSFWHSLTNEYQNLKQRGVENCPIRFDIISPENITVCSVTVLYHDNGIKAEQDPTQTREIRLDSDYISKLENEKLFETGIQPHFITISIQADCKSVCLIDFLHLVLTKIKNVHKINSIIQLESYNNRISNFILNSFVTRDYKFQIGFKNITFHFKRIVNWLSKCSKLYNVSFTNCIFLLNNKHAKMLEMMKNQNINLNSCKLNLTFRNMNFDVKVIAMLSQSLVKIIYNRCNLTSSSSVIIPPKFLKTIVCENMTVDWQVLVPLVDYVSFVFDKCQIQSNLDPILYVDAMAKPSQGATINFENMNIDAEVVLNISVFKNTMDLDRCCILSNQIGKIPSNYPTINGTITMDNVKIEAKAAAKIFNRFDTVIFISSRFMCTDLSTPEIPLECHSILQFYQISITPEFIKGLEYLHCDHKIMFGDCQMTNQNLAEIGIVAKNCKLVYITSGHQVDDYFYLELIARVFKNRLDVLLKELKNGMDVPCVDWFKIQFNEKLSNRIDWHNIKIRCVHVYDGTVKLEYMKNGKVLDIFYEQNGLLDDSDICEVDYY